MENLVIDLVLQEVIHSSNFNPDDSNCWKIISNLLPGYSIEMIQSRYNEICKETPYWLKPKPKYNKQIADTSLKNPQRDSDNVYTIGGQNPHLVSLKTNNEISIQKSYLGPTMVIHVCDEAKGVKQDFHCPRDLLVSEMRYFAEYLSNEAQRWEEVDISVHCDVHIFDWLMSYVKREKTGEKFNTQGSIQPTNVISILISSDFLKMDSLVDICIDYCYQNMNAILATPCNMNCINEKLVSRIADKFTDSETDEIRDKKDKFKSKIFLKKIERLFDKSSKRLDCPENASTLYKCLACKKILTHKLASTLPCILSRLSVDNVGNIIYAHKPDPNWDASEHVAYLRSTLPSWRDVYWKLWGTINFLKCLRCDAIFPCSELDQCRFHPETARYDMVDEERSSSSIGVYSCCGTKTLRFEPFYINKGCQTRDHLIIVPTSDSSSSEDLQFGSCEWNSESRQKVYENLLAKRDVICSRVGSSPELESATPETKTENANEIEEINLFAAERMISGLLTSLVDRGDCSDAHKESDCKTFKLLPLNNSDGTVLQHSAILASAPSSALSSSVSAKKGKKWDATKTLRANQDAQRQDDMKRMKNLQETLSRLRALSCGKSTVSTSVTNSVNNSVAQKEYQGGIYCRLEAQWRATHVMPTSAGFNTTGGLLGRNSTGPLQRGKTKMQLQSSTAGSSSTKPSSQGSTVTSSSR